MRMDGADGARNGLPDTGLHPCTDLLRPCRCPTAAPKDTRVQDAFLNFIKTEVGANWGGVSTPGW